jgi:hypothetical protein
MRRAGLRCGCWTRVAQAILHAGLRQPRLLWSKADIDAVLNDVRSAPGSGHSIGIYYANGRMNSCLTPLHTTVSGNDVTLVTSTRGTSGWPICSKGSTAGTFVGSWRP